MAGERRRRAGGKDGMRSHLSAAELGFLLGRLPLEDLPEVAEGDRRGLDSRVSDQAASTQPQSAWKRPASAGRPPARHNG